MIRRIVARHVLVLLLAVALVGASAVLLGCAASAPTDPAAITGTVTSLVPGDGRPASMLVVGSKSQPTSSTADKAQVTIAPQTQFLDAAGKLGDPATIRVGTKVSVWFQGAVAESYPVQGTAQAVQILGR